MWQSFFRQAVYATDVLRRQWQPDDQIQALQNRRLRAIVRYAARHVPFYRDRFEAAGVDPETVNGIQDLPRLPLTNKDEVQANYPDRMLAQPMRPDRYHVVTTSGTSGLVMNIAHDNRASDYYKALAYRHLYEIGYRPWHRLAYFRHEPHSQQVWERLGLARQYFISSLTPVEQQIELLKACRPHIVSAYPSVLWTLTRGLSPRQRADLVRPVAVLCHSELLPPVWRESIASAFGCGVFDDYSSLEFYQMAFECRQHRYHIHADNVVLEFLRDGQPVEPGEVGEIVVTGLVNRAMPLIRYCIGDMGALGVQPCPCGRGLPTMKVITGRKEDMLLTADRRELPPLIVLAAMHDFMNRSQYIAHYQLRQQALDRFQVRVVPQPAVDRSLLTEAVRDYLCSLLGSRSKIDVRFVESLPQGKTGKVRIVFNEMYGAKSSDAPDPTN
jgi:phenylacetate-CoA ligase